MARTLTKANTYLRLSLLKLQVRLTLIRVAHLSEEELARTVDQAMDDRTLTKVKIYGMDEQNVCQAGLILTVDWEEHQLQLDNGRKRLSIDSRWRNEMAPEIDEAIRMYSDFVEHEGLRIAVHYNIDGDFEKYGLVSAPAISLAEALKLNVPELSELSIAVFLPS